MGVILASLIIIYLKREIGTLRTLGKDKFILDTPVSVYFGWITVATILNVAAYLIKIGPPDLVLPPVIWAIVLVAVAGILGLAMLYRHMDVFYAMVLIWAFGAIMVKQMNASEPEMGIIIACIVTSAVLLGAGIYGVIKKGIYSGSAGNA